MSMQPTAIAIQPQLAKSTTPICTLLLTAATCIASTAARALPASTAASCLRPPCQRTALGARNIREACLFERHFSCAVLSTAQRNRRLRFARVASSGRSQFYHRESPYQPPERELPYHDKARDRTLCSPSSTAKAGSIATAELA